MKSLYVIFVILIFNIFGISAQTWSIESKVSKERYSILKGKIDGKYNITMYLIKGDSLCGKIGYANQWRNRTLKGWYYYDNFKIKIPLVGSYYPEYDGGYTELFVPNNYYTKFNYQTCKLENYQERFSNSNSFDLTNLKWSNNNGDELKSVILDFEKDEKLETNANIIFKIRNIEIKQFNVSKQTMLKYIEDIYDLDAKEIDEEIYLTFSFYEYTNPGSSGGGNCGAGSETYLGFLHLNNQLKVIKFIYKKIDSCSDWKSIEYYTVEKGSPELGLIKEDE